MPKDTHPIKIDSIAALQRILGLPKSRHPLIHIVDNCDMVLEEAHMGRAFSIGCYTIAYKATVEGKMGYGQGYYDFDEGGMLFTAPHQIIGPHEQAGEYTGYSLFIHPDFIRNSPLGRQIHNYGFFAYDTNEALHLSESEKDIILALFRNMEHELQRGIDETSQDVLLSYLELLLNYSQRFYKRQFITRKVVNHDLLNSLEQVLETYFNQEKGLQMGLPTVDYLATQVGLSPRYLSDMLRTLTGRNAQQHIHDKLIEKAKQYLGGREMTVSEIAYQLGFEYPQSFSKLFKNKTSLSPSEYVRSLLN